MKKSWRAVSRLSDSTSRHTRHDERDLHDTCSRASPKRGVDISTSLFLEVVPDIYANPKHKSLNLKREHYTASSSSDMLEQARCNAHEHDKRDTSCVLCHDVSWRDATSGIWAIADIIKPCIV